jgi:hypothetical protein
MIELANRPANTRNRRSHSYDGKARRHHDTYGHSSTLENVMSLAQLMTER